MNRVTILLFAAATFVLAHGSFCFAADREPVKVGVILPLSGPLMEMGTSFKRGVEVYSADYPKAPVSFVFEDDRYEGKTAVTALHALRSKPGIDLAIVWGNTPAGAVAPVAEQQRIPTLTISNDPNAKGRRYVVSIGFSNATEAERIAQQFKVKNATKVGAVTVDMSSAIECVDLVGQRVPGGIFKKIVANEEVDFKAIIPQLKSRNIDGVVLFVLPQQALTFLSQARHFDYAPTIVGGDVFALESFRQDAARLSEKISYVYGSVDESFIQRLSSSPGGTSYFFETATGYSLAAMSAALAERRKKKGVDDDPFSELKEITLPQLPLPKIEYKDDPAFGRHFEVDNRVYQVGK